MSSHSYHDRMDMGYLPSHGEHLFAYVARLKSVVEQNRYAYSKTHETWFTHRSASPCWICNFMDCCDYLVGVLEDFVTEDRKNDWKCHKPPGIKDATYFVFKPYPKNK